MMKAWIKGIRIWGYNYFNLKKNTDGNLYKTELPIFLFILQYKKTVDTLYKKLYKN